MVSSEQQEDPSGSARAFSTADTADSRSAGIAEAKAAVARLKSQIPQAGDGWKITVLEAIADWPLANETINGERFDYLIGGEAFNWRLLAGRLLEECGSSIPEEVLTDWLSDPVLFGGLDEPEFMRAVGVDKFRAHLSYFYGVTVEQSLLVSVEDEIIHWRVASGRQLNDRSLEAAYERLYGSTRDQLWEVFKLESGVGSAREGWRHRDEHSLGTEDAFTYWLFKLRLERSDPAKIASDTRKGLARLELMRQNDIRRIQLRKSDELRQRTRQNRDRKN
ncbi:MAG: hypothetical protein O3B95_03130 [Chloroflexi bacterium]|nr:hypothetical protein [Chloroflexota bacterium]